MLPLERHRLIVELLGQHGVMRVNEIAQATRVSRETIRRDLSELERKGILTRSHGGALAAENPLPATRAAASALPVEDSREAFSTERCCTAKAKCAWPVKHCSFSNRDRPLSRTGVAPAGFGPADAGDGVDGDYALHSHLTNSDEPTLVASRRAGDFSPTEESFFGETASRTLRG